MTLEQLKIAFKLINEFNLDLYTNYYNDDTKYCYSVDFYDDVLKTKKYFKKYGMKVIVKDKKIFIYFNEDDYKKFKIEEKLSD